jgi:PAS domain S-box-containing protein
MKSGLDDYVLKAPHRYIRVPVSVRVALDRLYIQRRAALTDLRLQSLLNQLNVGIFRSHPTGELLDANPALLELLGVSTPLAAQALLKPYLQTSYQQLKATSLSRSQDQELEFQRGDGGSIWLLLNLTLSSINGADVLDGLLENITDRKQAELQLQQLNQSLEERVNLRTAELESANQNLERSNRELTALAERLRDANQNLEEFAYSISHDLRAPIRAIEGFARILLEAQSQRDAESNEYLKRIATIAEQANALITNLLTYSQLGQGDLLCQPVSLTRVLQTVLQQLEAEIQQHQAQITVESPLPTVMGNFPLLIQVLTNLLSNAIKFASPSRSPQVRIWAEPRSKSTRLWVEDNGIGIAPADQQRIFQAFERLHGIEEYPGTGIGLAIVRRGIDRMGGQVGVDSQPGQGSRFWIELPTAPEEC